MNDLLKALCLRHVEKGLPELYEQARMHALTYDAFLRRVLLMEVEGRKFAAQHKRLKEAKLPTRKTLEEFDFRFQPSLNERQLWELADLSFVKTNRNVVLLGPPGVGKPQSTRCPRANPTPWVSPVRRARSQAKAMTVKRIEPGGRRGCHRMRVEGERRKGGLPTRAGSQRPQWFPLRENWKDYLLVPVPARRSSSTLPRMAAGRDSFLLCQSRFCRHHDTS